MVAKNTLSQSAKTGVPIIDDINELCRHAGDETSQRVVLNLYQRLTTQTETTVWDLHQLLGIPVSKVFVALRSLEYGKIIDIVDNPSDPYGAFVRIRDNGLETLQRRAAA